MLIQCQDEGGGEEEAEAEAEGEGEAKHQCQFQEHARLTAMTARLASSLSSSVSSPHLYLKMPASAAPPLSVCFELISQLCCRRGHLRSVGYKL